MSDHQHPGNGSPESGNEKRDGHHDEIAHVTPVRLLLLIWGALMVLTFITVGVTMVDLGAQTNLIIAMAIATIKAGLVVTGNFFDVLHVKSAGDVAEAVRRQLATT